MRLIAISLLALITLSGCVALHAEIPADMVRQLAREDGVELGAVCSLDGRNFSEGAITCMAGRQMTCDATGRWQQDGGC